MRQSGKRRSGARAALALAVVLLAVLCTQTAARLWENHVLRAEFVGNGRGEAYERGVPVTEMDFDSFSPYLVWAVTAAYTAMPDISLEWDLHYYAAPDPAAEPMFTIPAGTGILWWEGAAPHAGYGLYGYPIYEAGWRYVQPFVSAGGDTGEAAPCAFIRTGDLERVAREILSEAPGLQQVMRAAGLSEKDAASRMVRTVDQLFYANGVFLSPDLYEPVWTWDSTLLAAGAAVLLGVWLVLRRLPERTTGGQAAAFCGRSGAPARCGRRRRVGGAGSRT